MRVGKTRKPRPSVSTPCPDQQPAAYLTSASASLPSGPEDSVFEVGEARRLRLQEAAQVLASRHEFRSGLINEVSEDLGSSDPSGK